MCILGTITNAGRNAIVNVSEIVCYDIIKDTIIGYNLMKDSVPCHFTSAVIAGMFQNIILSHLQVIYLFIHIKKIILRKECWCNFFLLYV